MSSDDERFPDAQDETQPPAASEPPKARWGGYLAIGVVVAAVLILVIGFLAG